MTKPKLYEKGKAKNYDTNSVFKKMAFKGAVLFAVKEYCNKNFETKQVLYKIRWSSTLNQAVKGLISGIKTGDNGKKRCKMDTNLSSKIAKKVRNKSGNNEKRNHSVTAGSVRVLLCVQGRQR